MGLEAEGFIGFDYFGIAAAEHGIGRDLVVFLELVHFEDDLTDIALFLDLGQLQGRLPVDLLKPNAAGLMPVVAGHALHRDRRGVAAAGDEIVAARAEVTARRAFMGQGEIARDGLQGPRVFIRPRQRDRTEQRLRIGMLHLVKDILDRAFLDRFARVHHADPVAGFQHQSEVVRDEEHRGAVFLAQILHQFHHRRLDGHVERGGRLIEDQERGFGHQRHGDDDTLLLAARKLVRIGLQDALGVRQLYVRDHLQGARVGFLFGHAGMDHRHFHQLFADPHGGIEARHRFLVDHRDLAAAYVA